jgi:hypothetical protein
VSPEQQAKRGFWDFERMGDPLASPAVFRRRLITSGGVAAALITFSLLLGIAGYHWLVGIPDWVDCLLSASMILGGMGPVGTSPSTVIGKLFASFYAIYSGVMLLASVGVLLTPGLHRILHYFHLRTDGDEE